MNTTERLQGYYPFDHSVVERVSLVAERQMAMPDFGDFFAHTGLTESVRKIYDGYAPIDILDIRPKDHDPRAAMVVHLAMANPLDPNNLYQISTIAAVHPTTRIIASANPSGFGYNSGLLNKDQRQRVAGGDFGPVVEPLMKYIEDKDNPKVETIQQVGYSYGADRAATSAKKISGSLADTSHLVAIEPASVVKRSLIGISQAFGSTNKALNTYVKANELPAFISARKESVGMLAYVSGLARLSNIAVARGLTDGKFNERVQAARISNSSTIEQMSTTLAWGTESELADNEAMEAIFSTLASDDSYGKVQAIRLENHKHALANDVHLQAAIVAQALL